MQKRQKGIVLKCKWKSGRPHNYCNLNNKLLYEALINSVTTVALKSDLQNIDTNLKVEHLHNMMRILPSLWQT